MYCDNSNFINYIFSEYTKETFALELWVYSLVILLVSGCSTVLVCGFKSVTVFIIELIF